MKFQAKIQNNQLIFDDVRSFYGLMEKWDGVGVTVNISKPSKSRSDNQNRYLWGCLYDLIGRELGYSPEEVHDAMKYKFLTKVGRLVTTRSTTELTTVEFEEYCSNIRQFASSDLGIFCPLPNETEYDYK